MSKHKKTTASRRGFLKLIGGGITLLPLAAINGCSGDDGQPAATPAPGASPQAAPQAPPATAKLPRLAEDDPTAQALGYRHDATAVDAARFPQRAGPEGAQQVCDNCALFQPSADAEWAPCTIFPGKAVNAKGWCSAWAAKAG